MKLEAVHLDRFRSAKTVALENLGPFNVLIGKNNAGKSTILTGIDAFFKSLKEGDVINLAPPAGEPVDFFDSDFSQPIRLGIAFRQSEGELSELQQAIKEGTPQLEEAARALSVRQCLHVTVRVVSAVSPYSFVETVELREEGEVPRTLLAVSLESAEELREIKSLQQQSSQDKAVLRVFHQRLDQDDWESYRRTRGAPPPMTYWLRRRGPERLTRETEIRVNELWQGLESFDAFKSEIAALTDSIDREIQAAQERELKTPVRTFGGEEPRIPPYVADLLQNIGALKVHYLRERREPIGRQEAEQLLELKVRRGGIERLQEIQATVSGLLGVGIDAFEGGTRQRSSVAEMDVDDFVVQVNGAGIREALRIVLDVEFGEPDILLVEEPEIHLHPAMETSLMQYLKRIGSRTQVAVSTHSTNFLDVAEMRNVYLVSKTQKETGVQLLNPSDAEAEIPRELGIRLSSLFMFDRLAFVEGPTDEAVLREWAANLGLNLSYANVGFVSMGGARNFAYFAAERTLAFLSNRQVEIWFVLDRDERDDDEVQRMTTLAGEHPHVVVLERRELENYLIKPGPLAEFVGIKRELGGLDAVEIPVEAVEEALESSAESLKGLTLEKRIERAVGRPLYFDASANGGSDPTESAIQRLEDMRTRLDERFSQITDVVGQITTEVDELWSTRKLDLVPGEELLDAVCKRWDTRYRKERGDGAKLASLMKADEIPGEMQDLLTSLAT